jgi:EF hand
MVLMSHSTVRKQMTQQTTPTTAAGRLLSSRRQLVSLYAGAMMFTLIAALFALSAHAQTAAPAAPAQATAPPATTVAAGPKYATKDIALAFSLIDANKDGKISRDEAAGFRGVARHFDEADTNKDQMLSREEFESALSGEKSR